MVCGTFVHIHLSCMRQIGRKSPRVCRPLVSDVWLQEIKETKTKDQSMQMLRNLIQFGWPEKQSQVPKKIQEYWNIRDQLSEVDGILLKN